MGRFRYTFTLQNHSSGTTARTLTQFKGAANYRFGITSIEVSARGTAATDPQVPLTVRHADGDGTFSSTLTAVKRDRNAPETAHITASYTPTVEPSNQTIIACRNQHGQGFTRILPPAGEEQFDISNGKSILLCMENVGTSQTLDITAECAEG